METISLRHASAVVNRVILSAAGTLGKDGVVSNGAFTLEASDGARLQAALPQAWQATPALWQGPVKLAVQAAGPLDALSLGIRLNLSDANLDARPVVNLRNGQWNGELTIRHPGAPRFVSAIGLPERLGLPNLPQLLGDGSFSLTARLSGTPNTVSAERFEMTAGDVRLAGRIALDASGALPRVSGQISTDALAAAAAEWRVQRADAGWHVAWLDGRLGCGQRKAADRIRSRASRRQGNHRGDRRRAADRTAHCRPRWWHADWFRCAQCGGQPAFVGAAGAAERCRDWQCADSGRRLT